MSEAAVTPDVHQPLYIHLRLTAECALDFVFCRDDLADPCNFVITKFADMFPRFYSCFVEDLERGGVTDSENVRQSVLCTFVFRQIDSCYSCQIRSPLLTLALFVFRVLLADNSHDTFALYDLAVVAEFLY